MEIKLSCSIGKLMKINSCSNFKLGKRIYWYVWLIYTWRDLL